MSFRTVARFALVGWLGMSLAAPVAAQSPPGVRVLETRTGSFLLSGSANTDAPIPVAPAATLTQYPKPEVAPMPRVAVGTGLRLNVPMLGPLPLAIDLAFPLNKGPIDRGQTIHVGVGVFGGPEPTPEVGPMPRVKNAVQIEFGIELGGGPVLFGPGPVRIGEEEGFSTPLNGQPVAAPQPPAGTPGYFVLDDRGFEIIQSPSASLPNPMIALGACRRDDNGTWWVEVVRVPQPKHSPVRQIRPFCEPQAAESVAKPACCNTNGARGAALGGGHLPPNLCMNVGMREPSVASCKFSGTWVREMEGIVVAATLSPCGEELKLCMTQHAEGHTVCFTVTADCKVTKEGLLHGAITGVDVGAKCDPKATGDSSFGTEIAEMAMGLQEMVDAPFSFRMKQTSAGLMVSNLKLGSVGPVSAKELAILCGMFKPCKDGSIPTPKPMKVTPTQFGGMTLPSPRYLEHYPQYFSPDPVLPLPRELKSQEDPAAPQSGGFGTVSRAPVAPAPRECQARDALMDAAEALRLRGAELPPALPAAPRGYGAAPPMACPAPPCYPPVPCPTVEYGFTVPVAPPPQRGPASTWNPAQPGNVPANEFGMMADVFGQMIGAKSPPQYLPPVPATPPVAVQTLGYVVPPVPEGACPPCPLPTSTRPSITGTWVREVGPVVYLVKIAPDYLTISVTAATEMGDGKLMTQELVLTADYHLGRDGTTLVGLITGVDSTVNGELTGDSHADLQALQEELSQFQKGYTDKPYAMTVRVYGDSLVIGNVRLPQAKDVQDSDTPLGIIGGRYRNVGDKMFPKPKPTKAGPVRAASPGLSDAELVRTLPPPPVAESPYAPSPTWSPPAPRPTTDRVAPPCPADAPRLGPPATVCPAPGLVPAGSIPPPSPRDPLPAVSPMAVPTLPVIEGAQTERKSAATAVVVIWKGRVEHLPDPTRNGEKVAGLSGQLFLHDARMHPASANGRLTVAVYDETPLPAGQTGNVPEVWVFRADDLKKLATPDERFGQCYSLFLPWPAYRPGVTRVRIAVRYEPENGRPLHAPEARLTLDPPAKPEVAPASAETPKAKKNKKQAAEEFPGILLNVYSSDPSILNAVPPLPRATEPTAPPMAVPAPPMPSEYPKAKKKKKQAAHALPGILLNQYSSDPNVRMQQLLYQSEDLRQMQNEWRRFWFNDHPSHLTPERIHGGIQ